MRASDERPGNSSPRERSTLWLWIICLGGVLVCFLAILLPRISTHESPGNDAVERVTVSAENKNPRAVAAAHSRLTHRRATIKPGHTAEETVALKLTQFGRARRELARTLARKAGKELPDQVERFFDTVERGNREEIEVAFASLRGAYVSEAGRPELQPFWRCIQEAWGVANAVHTWPAQQLLDYGETILGSLRPRMVYVGGTDSGCFIPTFLNETSDGERHIVLTQNALADGSYLDFLQNVYGDRMAMLTQEDSQRGFQSYIGDMQKRLDHDRRSPDEPKQIKPGENAVVTDDGRIQVAGQLAVMSINEKLFQTLMEKNPELSFAIEQSFPFVSTYVEASPLGPIMELRVRDAQNALTAERAAQSVEYWRDTVQQLQADPAASGSTNAQRSYSKMAADQASLLLERNLPAEAEQAFQLANDLCPSNPEVVFRYVDLLTRQGRTLDAAAVLQRAANAAPDNAQFQQVLQQLKSQ